MKYSKVFLGFLLVVMLVTACAKTSTPLPAQPTSVPPTAVPPTEVPPTEVVPTALPTPTAEATVSADPTWDRVQANKKIVIGTSADYQPFEYYDSNFQIVGFDAAIARELGTRLGLQVELVDMVFEWIPTALQTGQIDAAIAAISVTQERQAILDFTNVYYSGQDSVLARQGSGIANIISPVQLVPFRVGVQRGSTYQAWVQKNLVDTGLMPAANLLAYEKPEHAVRDLKENRNDLVLMGTIPAQEFLLSGGLEIIGQGLNTQLFAIALPKGSPTLREMLNQKLTDMKNDGTMANFGTQYLQVDLSKVPPIPTPTPYPTAVIPTPTAVPCYDGMAFISDVKIPDGTQIDPNEDFDKVWRIQNTGTCKWDSNYQVVFVQGTRMEGTNERIKQQVNPGQTYDLIIDQKAPRDPGSYQGVWQMVNSRGAAFGERLWVRINVPGAPPPTPVPPTATVPAPVQPTLVPGPVINSFTLNPNVVNLGEIVVVNWSFSGSGIVSARLTRTDPDGTIVPLYGGADVDPQGQYEDMVMKPGITSYSLTVSSEFAGTAALTIFVTVNP